jgi:enoyl-CoA hydratase/carnithine racemase
VTLGFIPGAGATQRLPRLVGLQRAKELILTGRRFDAQEAAAMGLIARVVAHDRLLEEALTTARAIAANPRMSVIQAKLALNASQETLLAAGLQAENEAWLPCLLSDVWKGRIERFAER